MTKKEIKAEVKDLTVEIETLEKQETSAWWPEWEKTRDLAQLRAKREEWIAKL